ncbi:hypothetical protein ACJDU8_08845 [Clostridium sp. WILCCON 0269]|uniref:Uncharacterized protein n=1 Tax=Candidatus Clostridium eludens TaxID=3381663 RepID=A0ABW8SI11_9CLOT
MEIDTNINIITNSEYFYIFFVNIHSITWSIFYANAQTLGVAVRVTKNKYIYEMESMFKMVMSSIIIILGIVFDL